VRGEAGGGRGERWVMMREGGVLPGAMDDRLQKRGFPRRNPKVFWPVAPGREKGSGCEA